MSLLYIIGEWIKYYFTYTIHKEDKQRDLKISNKDKYLIFCKEIIPNHTSILSKKLEDVLTRIVEEYENNDKIIYKGDIINFFKEKHKELCDILNENQNSGESMLLTEDQYDEIYIYSVLKDYNNFRDLHQEEIEVEEHQDDDLEDFLLL